jgi:hypothetical protein
MLVPAVYCHSMIADRMASPRSMHDEPAAYARPADGGRSSVDSGQLVPADVYRVAKPRDRAGTCNAGGVGYAMRSNPAADPTCTALSMALCSRSSA